MEVKEKKLQMVGSITGGCSGKEPALFPRGLFSGRNEDRTLEGGGNRTYPDGRRATF